MPSPFPARIDPRLRKAFLRYCAEHGVTQSEAMEKGLRLLLNQVGRRKRLTPAMAVVRLRRLRSELADRLKGFSADQAESEGRD